MRTTPLQELEGPEWVDNGLSLIRRSKVRRDVRFREASPAGVGHERAVAVFLQSGHTIRIIITYVDRRPPEHRAGELPSGVKKEAGVKLNHLGVPRIGEVKRV